MLAQRASLSDLSAAWRGLTDAQRAGWQGLAGSVLLHNSMGAVITLTGHQTYVRVNRNRASLALARVDDAPALPAFTTSPFLGIVTLTGAGVFTINLDVVPAGTIMVVDCSPPISAGRSFNAVFRRIAQFPAGVAVPAQTIATPYHAKFGAVPVGSKVFVRASQDIGGFRDVPVLASKLAA